MSPARAQFGLFTFEAEAGANDLLGGATVVSCGTCSGGLKVGYLGYSGSLRVNNVMVPTTQMYKISIRYATAELRSATITVNGGTSLQVDFPSTGDWYTFDTAVVAVLLSAGSNQISFSNSSGWAPDIDVIDIAPQLTLPATGEYEAEASANVLSAGAARSVCNGCSGGSKVALVGIGSMLTIANVEAPAEGTYVLSVSYTATEARTASIAANDSPPAESGFDSSGSAETPATKLIILALRVGLNRVAFSNASGLAPDIDKLTFVNMPALDPAAPGLATLSSTSVPTAPNPYGCVGKTEQPHESTHFPNTLAGICQAL
jgi:hypothetical protein